MKNRITIGDFVKLTGSTLKTVLYYHKIGLLPEPERSPGGYRLYGPVELTRMQLIKHLKGLGMDLKGIKEVLGDAHNHKTMREILQSLLEELKSEKTNLEQRIAKIEKLLDEDATTLDEDSFESPSFQMVLEILGHILIIFVFGENTYASPVIQVEEGQRVITTGPCAVVRHPMYLGLVSMILFTPLALGSYWAVIPALLCIPMNVIRILNEEEVLLRELAGYKDYCLKTRYRLIPLIW